MLSGNDQKILAAIQNQDGVQKRMEDLLVTVLKGVERLGSDKSPEARFLQNVSHVLQWMSKGHSQMISEDWVITSLEVNFYSRDAIGQGSFGVVFTGQWNAARVAIKQMYSDDARTLTETDRKKWLTRVYSGQNIHTFKIPLGRTTLHHPNILNLYGACLEATLLT
ncbi:hypothetical protein M422DRAFT_55190 [Sphaerobolus stellatus SS14]|uniref:Protein kinase domain-containing protein n=1 Tax=Sphaerobolus stellatus (strain SS14) TaxID=990650 RepID=A0A0C9TZ91_SPHS4|nr:hypothetical protein M422DRAFT_55190 [Sphaerobolus stellatus SS14]